MDLYANVQETQSRFKATKHQTQRYPAHKKREFPWHVIAAKLGILCFLLLLSTVILGYMFFQCSSKEKIKDNKGTNEKNTSLSEVGDQDGDSAIFHPVKEKDCDIDPGKWSCCGKNCYYFSKVEKTWAQSMKSCQDLGSNLIKIDDLEEQLFIQSKLKYSYWVGLHKTGSNSPWKWPDGAGPSWTLDFQANTSLSQEKCGRLKSTNIVDDVCTKEFHFICEKKSRSL